MSTEKKNTVNINLDLSMDIDSLVQAISRSLTQDEICLFIAKLDLNEADWGVTEKLMCHFESLKEDLRNEEGSEIVPKNLLK